MKAACCKGAVDCEGVFELNKTPEADCELLGHFEYGLS